MLFLAVLVATICVFLLAHRFLQKRRLLTLNWPRTLSHAQFAVWVARYLKYHGWKIETPELAVHVMTAKREKEVVRIYTECSLVEYNLSRVKDVSREALMRKPHPLVCVTAKPVAAFLMSAAARGQVLILYYKELNLVFNESITNQKDLLETLRVARLEQTPPKPEAPENAPS